jgi:hypothetical protein
MTDQPIRSGDCLERDGVACFVPGIVHTLILDRRQIALIVPSMKRQVRIEPPFAEMALAYPWTVSGNNLFSSQYFM